MADLNKFGESMAAFRHGTLPYSYNFNSAGNLFFKEDSNNVSESFLKVPVRNSEYDYRKFNKFYTLGFEEFSTQEPQITSSTDTAEYRAQINSLKSQISSSTPSVQDDSVYKLRSDLKASRDIIVGLRISAGEGRSEEDFSDTFPFYLKKDATISNK